MRRGNSARPLPRLKTTVPDALKADIPQTTWGKILGATPVVLTVIATMLAGLASSEMTRAQYNRSLAAQRQSKAGDQWSFFQSKRLRAALQNNTLDVIASTAEVKPFTAAALRAAMTDLAPTFDPALTLLAEGRLPAVANAPTLDAKIRAALTGVESGRSDAELDELVLKISDTELETALRDARAHALAFDEGTKPTNDAVTELDRKLTVSTTPANLKRDFTAARLAFQARRYDAEARLNQVIGSLYELQVRRSNLAAERHHRRSQKFFYGMLAAQLGVIVSTLAMAARRRNLLWALAAFAGAAAIAFAIYVYWYV